MYLCDCDILILLFQADPADFSFYFDTAGNRICNLAPERFYSGPTAPEGATTPAMDIFSLGYAGIARHIEFISVLWCHRVRPYM